MKKDNQIIRHIEESIEGLSDTSLYFEYINAKGLIKLQQEILEKVKCSNCGWCCVSCNVLLSENDIIRLCKHIRCDFGQFYEKYMDKETIANYLSFPCPFLDMNKEKKCAIYDVRPEVCKHFPFNASLLVIDPCSIGRDILKIIDERISYEMLSKMSGKKLDEFKKKLKKDEERAENTIYTYDKLEIFFPQFNQIYGHLTAVIDKEMLEKILKELK